MRNPRQAGNHHAERYPIGKADSRRLGRAGLIRLHLILDDWRWYNAVKMHAICFDESGSLLLWPLSMLSQCNVLVAITTVSQASGWIEPLTSQQAQVQVALADTNVILP